eukprot:Gb_29557 [translate_table: standard]
MARALKHHKEGLLSSPMLQLQTRKGTIESTIATNGLKTTAGGKIRSSSCVNVKTLCMQGRLKEAVQILQTRDQYIETSTYVCLFQGCANQKVLPEGKLIHAHMVEWGIDPDMLLGNILVTMYAKCGTVVDARRVLDQMQKRNVVSWTAMISGYAQNGHVDEALTMFYQMQREGIQPNQFTFASVLPVCANLAALEQGEKFHEEIIRIGFQSNVFVGNALVDMYAKCECIENARTLFDKMPQRNVVSWNTMIGGYAQNGHVDKALKLFQEMPERNVVSWTTMIAGYAQNRRSEEALKLFHQMQLSGLKPNSKTFAIVLPACANLADLDQGMEIHQLVIRTGLLSNIFVRSALVDMYAKCGSVENASQLFHKMPQQDVVSWNVMISGYTQNGHVNEAWKLFQTMPIRDVVSWNVMITGYADNGNPEEALMLFQQMQSAGLKPNSQTCLTVLQACANLGSLEQGKEIHTVVVRTGLQYDVFVGCALVDLYAKCGSIENARTVFDKMHHQDVVSWNAMIAGYAKNGHVDHALEFFQKMPEQVVVSWNAMIAGYAQNGHVKEALELFQKMPERDVVSWNAIIAGHAQHGLAEDALKLFQQMRVRGIKPNSETFSIILSACVHLEALDQGKKVHEIIIKNGSQFNRFVGSALVDMYAKCGSIENAQNVFDKMPQRDVVSWNAMIVGYALHGYGKEALQLFEQMQHVGVNPDRITFVGVLSACCHAGWVDEGWQLFARMGMFHVTPTKEHYCCMVDLLGRAGCLDEAQDFINKMPIKPDAAVWSSLLSACRIHANMELGECVAEYLFELEPENAAPYVLLSNIYATASRWNDIEKVRKMMNDRRVKNKPGCSWIEVNQHVYAFLAGDRSNPEMQKIYAELERLSGQMKAAGYVPAL